MQVVKKRDFIKFVRDVSSRTNINMKFILMVLSILPKNDAPTCVSLEHGKFVGSLLWILQILVTGKVLPSDNTLPNCNCTQIK
jgi:hypothetical protein